MLLRVNGSACGPRTAVKADKLRLTVASRTGGTCERRSIVSRCRFIRPFPQERPHKARRLALRHRSYCCCEQLQVVFVTTEVAPWSKVGGLGDVMSALPVQLACRGHAVMTVAPRYQAYNKAADTGLTVPVKVPSSHTTWTKQHPADKFGAANSRFPSSEVPGASAVSLQAYARLFHLKADGVDRVFVDHPLFLELPNGNASSYLEGTDAPSLDLQYSILCQAALAAPILIWHQPQHHLADLHQQAMQRSCPHTLSGGLVQLVSRRHPARSRLLNNPRHATTTAATSSSSGSIALGGDAVTASDKVDSSQHEQMRQWLATDPAPDPEAPDVIWPESAGRIAFVGNDWPCAPLSQHLTYLQSLSSTSPAINDGHIDEHAQPALAAPHPWAAAPKPKQGQSAADPQPVLSDAAASKVLSAAVQPQQLSNVDPLPGSSATLPQQDSTAAAPKPKPLPAAVEQRDQGPAQHTATSETVAVSSHRLLHEGMPAAEEEQFGHFTQSRAYRDFQVQMARLLKGARVAFCIHNMAHQGLFPQAQFSRLGLPKAMQSQFAVKEPFQPADGMHEPSNQTLGTRKSTYLDQGSVDSPVQPEAMDSPPSRQPGLVSQLAGHNWKPLLNWMQAALLSSHSLLTVSQAFAKDLVMRPGASLGLHHLLRTRNIRGITNGIDTKEWDPGTDEHLPSAARYSSSNVGQGKAAAKAALQQKYGLQPNPDTPLVAFLGRLAPQKGADVVLAALPHLMAVPEGRPADAPAGACQIVLLGAGEHWMEVCLQKVAQQYPGQAVGLPAVSEAAAHLLLAAADYVVVPSRCEPCGLVALYAQRYGALPIATPVGGLKDIVSEESGYLMPEVGEYGSPMHLRTSARMLASAVQGAVTEYGSDQFRSTQQRIMAADMSWEEPAKEWEQALRQMLAE